MPPQSGSLAYCVLQNDDHRQPVSLLVARRRSSALRSSVSSVAGYSQRPKLAASHPSPGQVEKAMMCSGFDPEAPPSVKPIA